MTDFDVVVIGAGNGGLTAAATLARSGVRTLLLETHNVPGGCATSFRRGRFEFEVALHQHSGVGTEAQPGPIRGLLQDLGVLDKLELIQMENLYRVVKPGELDITLKADKSLIIAVLKDRFPGEADKIDRFFKLLYDFCNEWLGVEIMRDPEASPAKYPLYFKYYLKNTQDVFDEFGLSQLLQVVLDIYWTYGGLPPKSYPFGDFSVMLWLYIEQKPWHIKGGSQMLSDTLLDSFINAGGVAWFNCGAKEIKVKDNAVTSVITENGNEVSTKRVISNAGTLTTYLDLIDAEAVPDSRLRQFGARQIGVSGFTLFMGFDCEPRELDITETTNFLITHPDSNQTYESSKGMKNVEYALFSCYDVDDPEFSPEGCCQASLLTLPYAKPWEDLPPGQYHDAKYEYAQKLLDILYQVFPKCRDHIEEIEVATPLTHMRYLGHPGGAIYGYDPAARNLQPFLDIKSPINGLYHCGAWAGSSGFQPSLSSGASTARAVFKTLS